MTSFLGERYVYKFVCDPDALFSMAYGGAERNGKETSPDLIKSSPAYSDVLAMYSSGGYAFQQYLGGSDAGYRSPSVRYPTQDISYANRNILLDSANKLGFLSRTENGSSASCLTLDLAASNASGKAQEKHSPIKANSQNLTPAVLDKFQCLGVDGCVC